MAGGLAAGSGAQLDRLKSVVVGTPGVVDPQSGAIALVPNIPGLSEIDVRRELGALFGGLDVLIENDVNLTMLGEAWRGAARGAENAAFVAVGTGVGLGLIVNGKLVRGATGAAGEIAYLPIGGDLVSPRALEVGAFELEVASTGIVEHYRRLGGSADWRVKSSSAWRRATCRPGRPSTRSAAPLPLPLPRSPRSSIPSWW